jgi:PAS domain S-box-containing protein
MVNPVDIAFNGIHIDFYRDILASIKDPLNILDKNLIILWTNKARAKIHQKDVSEMIGKPCYEMFMRKSIPCPECPVQLVFTSGKPSGMEKWVDLPSGERRYGEVRAYPIFDKKGGLEYALEITIDITDKKHDQERYQRYVEALERIVKDAHRKEAQGRETKSDERITLGRLTSREIDILRFIADGFSNTEIAKILHISPHTVKTHVIHIIDKLNAKDRTQAAVIAIQNRFI